MNPFDDSLFHALNHLAGHHHMLDAIMVFFAKDTPEVYAVAFIVLWFAYPRQESQRRHVLVMSVFAAVFAIVINLVISHLWMRPRPFAILPSGDFTRLIVHPNDSSFPSDHAALCFALAAAAWRRCGKWVSGCLTALAVLVMIARIYVGVHWPTDVLVGMVVGIVAGQMIWVVSRHIYPLTQFGLRLFHFGQFTRSQPACHVSD